MSDRPVNLGCVVAWALWAAVVLTLVASLEARDVYLATVGCMLSAGAATATIRAYFVTQNRLMSDALDLGQEIGRLEGRPELPTQRHNVRPMR